MGENVCVADNRNASLADMVRSIVVIGALILGLAGLGYWFQIRPDNTRKSVDYVTAAEAARGVADFAVLAPTSLPKGWTATTVSYDNGVKGQWHLGVLTDKEKYIGLEQTYLGRQRSIEKFAPETEKAGSTTAGGHSWELRRSPRGETTLIRADGDVTVVLTGTASLAVIKRYAQTLVDK